MRTSRKLWLVFHFIITFQLIAAFAVVTYWRLFYGFYPDSNTETAFAIGGSAFLTFLLYLRWRGQEPPPPPPPP